MTDAPPAAALIGVAPAAVAPAGVAPTEAPGEGSHLVGVILLVVAAAGLAAWELGGAGPAWAGAAVAWTGIAGFALTSVVVPWVSRRVRRRAAAKGATADVFSELYTGRDGRLRWQTEADTPTATAASWGLFCAGIAGFGLFLAGMIFETYLSIRGLGPLPRWWPAAVFGAGAAVAAVVASRIWTGTARGDGGVVLDRDRRVLTLPRSAVRATIRDGRFLPLRSPRLRGAARDLPFDRIAAVEHDRVVLPFTGQGNMDGSGIFLRLREPQPDGDERRILLLFQSDATATPSRNARLADWLRGELGRAARAPDASDGAAPAETA